MCRGTLVLFIGQGFVSVATTVAVLVLCVVIVVVLLGLDEVAFETA